MLLLLNQINVDSYCLEENSPRAASFDSLGFVPKNRNALSRHRAGAQIQITGRMAEMAQEVRV